MGGGGFPSDVSGVRRRSVESPSPHPMVLCPRRLQVSVRSPQPGGEGGTTLHLQSGPPAQSSPPPPWTMPAGIQRNFAECRPLECAASNKDHVSRIGHSHAAILLAQDFVRFHLRAAPCPKGRITRKTGNPTGWVLIGRAWFGGYQPFFEEEHVPAEQPTNNDDFPASSPQKKAGNKKPKQTRVTTKRGSARQLRPATQFSQPACALSLSYMPKIRNVTGSARHPCPRPPNPTEPTARCSGTGGSETQL